MDLGPSWGTPVSKEHQRLWQQWLSWGVPGPQVATSSSLLLAFAGEFPELMLESSKNQSRDQKPSQAACVPFRPRFPSP